MASPAGFGAQAGAFGDIGYGLAGLGKVGETLFGNSSTQKQSGTTKGTVTESLDISQEGVNKNLQKILGGEQGLASIFSEENVAGIYDSSVSAQASGDLLTKLAGEIAKLTATKTQATDSTTTAKTKGGSGGLLKQFGL